MSGKFIISLDFELHWGGAEKWDLSHKRNYFLNTRKSIPEVLKIFRENSIQVTWATVGFLFAKSKKQLLDFSPELKPTYDDQKLSSYNYFDQVGENEDKDPFHFGYSLIQQILDTPLQELASHTFSHYYCNEPGQTSEQFKADLTAAQEIANENFGQTLKSLVFPRNQYNVNYLKLAQEQNVRVIRSNPEVWFWKNTTGKFIPIVRAMDTLISVSKPLSFDSRILKNKDMITELPASRFFRPYKNSEEVIQGLKMSRIKNEMTFAAKNNLDYHLWWHPHNFGENVTKNILQLKEIIKHYSVLNDKYGFQSALMRDYENV